jgi:CRISPR-associated protein Cas6
MTDARGMIDLVFDLGGEALSAGYPFALWAELVRHVPQLADDTAAGVLPLRTAESGEAMLLPKRAKLVLRLPQALAGHAAALSGRQLDVGDGVLRLGAGKLREIQPHVTLQAQLVAGADDEIEFMKGVAAELAALGIEGNLICGMRRSLSDGQRTIHGYGLVIHDLRPEESLRLQCTGLGADRHLGCGIFIPYKVISGLDW